MAALLLLPFAAMASPIFPEPRQWKPGSAGFTIGADTVIVIAADASDADRQAAHVLSAELADTFGVGVPIVRAGELPARSAIVIGDTMNPVVRAAFTQRDLPAPIERHAEGYALLADAKGAVLAGFDEAGTFYAVQSARQLLRRRPSGEVEMIAARVVDWPLTPFRGARMFLPGRDHLPFFRRLVADCLALYKFNRLILEFNGGMRFDRHPEVNVGARELERSLTFSRRDRPRGPHGEGQDSSHQDTADGGVLEQSEVAELVQWCRAHHIEVIPEVPTLTHSYYLLARHHELAEVPDAEWPDAYCPLAPGVYPLVFDVLDEISDVVHPRMINIGHDEWRIPVGECPRCKGRDYGDLFVDDLRRIHDHLAARGIRTAMWADDVEAGIRPYEKTERTVGDRKYHIPGALSKEQLARIPHDILLLNWGWLDRKGGTTVEKTFAASGFEQVFGNFTPEMRDAGTRLTASGVLGGAASLWSATTEWNFGKDLIHSFLGSAALFWSEHPSRDRMLVERVQAMMPDIRRRLSGGPEPSKLGNQMRTIVVGDAGAAPIVIDEDPLSLIFVHSLAQPGVNQIVHRVVYNPRDTSGLLGTYEIQYEDGLILPVEIRYGWNILERGWPAVDWMHLSGHPTLYCYAADAVSSAEGTHFAFEWPNPRPGKRIATVRLRQLGRADNPVILHAVKVTAARAQLKQ